MFSVFFGVFMRGRADVVKNSVSGVFSVFKKGKMVFRAQHTTNTENHQNTPEIEILVFYGGLSPPVRQIIAFVDVDGLPK